MARNRSEGSFLGLFPGLRDGAPSAVGVGEGGGDAPALLWLPSGQSLVSSLLF